MLYFLPLFVYLFVSRMVTIGLYQYHYERFENTVILQTFFSRMQEQDSLVIFIHWSLFLNELEVSVDCYRICKGSVEILNWKSFSSTVHPKVNIVANCQHLQLSTFFSTTLNHLQLPSPPSTTLSFTTTIFMLPFLM